MNFWLCYRMLYYSWIKICLIRVSLTGVNSFDYFLTMLPGKLASNPNHGSAAKSWRHCKWTFSSFVNKFITTSTSDNVDENKLSVLIRCADSEFYEYFDQCTSFSEAEKLLEHLYAKGANNISARLSLLLNFPFLSGVLAGVCFPSIIVKRIWYICF